MLQRAWLIPPRDNQQQGDPLIEIGAEIRIEKRIGFTAKNVTMFE
ncbi:MAG: hypothetical protein V1850_01310 [Candidatus Bathyarchaeota archaeon]